MGWRHKHLCHGTVGVGDVRYNLGATGEIISPEVTPEHAAFFGAHPDFAPFKNPAAEKKKAPKPKAAPKAKAEPEATAEPAPAPEPKPEPKKAKKSSPFSRPRKRKK